jgi:hypothetical protein
MNLKNLIAKTLMALAGVGLSTTLANAEDLQAITTGSLP